MKLPKGTRLAIRQALEKTHSASERKRILTRTQTLYNSFIREAPAPGGMNLLRSQYYGGLSVFAFYEAMDRNVEPDVLQEILYEDFPAKLIEVEKSGTRSFFEQCLPYIAKPENLSENFGNQCSAMIVHTVFDCLLNGKKESDTIRETQLASEFCLEGLRAVLGL